MSRHLYTEHDALIKTYAAAGRARRVEQTRLRQRRLGIACSGAAAAVLAGYLAVDTNLRLPELPSRTVAAPAPVADTRTDDLRRARELNAALQAELQTVAANREELTRQRESLAVQRAELDAETVRLEERRMSLGAARAELEADGLRIEERESLIAQQEHSLHSRREALERESPQLQASIDTLARQRQELDEQRQRFRAQRNLLEHEITLLQEQRAALESQQAELRDQWESLQVLIQQVSDARDLLRDRQAPADAPGMLELPQGDALLAAAEPVIDESELGEIRGGIDTGDSLDITIGLTRTVDVNGIEQYSSALQFGDITPATAEQIGSLPPVVVQNGPGNSVESAALGAVSGSVPVIIQNTLDNQHIVNMNVLDITVGNIGSQVSGAASSSAVSESMSLQN